MRVLLINAPQARGHHRLVANKNSLLPVPPLHLGYLAAVLEQRGHEVKLLDLNIARDAIGEFKHTLGSFLPGLMGISSTTASFSQAAGLAWLSKEILPPCAVVLGGCHVTFMATQVLEENLAVDIVVRGEGERTLEELVDCLEASCSPEGILGLSYRQNGDIVHNPPRPFIQNLDTLPWPARHLMDMTQYDTPGSLISSRGCPARCIFCASSAMSGHRYRTRKPECVVDEMEHLYYEQGIRRLFIMDDTFTGSPRRLTLPVCAEIRRRGSRLDFGSESRVDVATPQLIEALRKAGCYFIQFGVESGSPRVLATLKKGITLDQVRRAVGHAVGLGMQVSCSFILGHPDETEEDVHRTLDFAEELYHIGACQISISPLVPYPGTDVYERREMHGITLHTSDWNDFVFGTTIVSTRHLSRERMRELYVEASVKIALWSKDTTAPQGDRS